MTPLEHELIPYEASALSGERLLVIAPHPDDEVIGSGGVIARHRTELRLVRVVIVTDGTEGGKEGEPSIRDLRETESREALALLGVDDVRFLRLSDRQLSANAEALEESLEAEIRDFSPDLVIAPSPVEIHPDHAAIARALVQLAHRDASLTIDLPLTRIAFCEISQPIRPNLLVDITAEAERKFEAIRRHASQSDIRDYESFARGLNRYRTMTLPPDVAFAEGYWVTDLRTLRTTPWSELQAMIGPRRPVEESRAAIGISVVIRTRDRLGLLAEAIESVLANDYPASIVVVNDGGKSPREVVARFDGPIALVEHEESRGRSEAMNSGVRAAEGEFIAFLDDDDLFYPEHLATLATAAARRDFTAWYTDAVSAFVGVDENGKLATRDRMRMYAADFDRDLLLVDNYIPLTTLLVPRDAYFDAGGFDPAFDLFEDWEFLIRLARRGGFVRIPRVTCEVRHFEGGSSIILSSAEGGERFRSAKLQVWEKHRDVVTPAAFLSAWSSEKGRAQRRYSELVEMSGRARHAENDVTRLGREKALLLAELHTVAEECRRIEQSLKEAEQQHREAERAAAEASAAIVEMQAEIARAHAEIERAHGDVASLRSAVESKDAVLPSLFAEIDRLNAVIAAMQQSRTWKMHQAFERIVRKR